MGDLTEQLNGDTPTPTVEGTSVEGRPVLVSDEITNRQAQSGKPTYGVKMAGKDGVSKPVLAASGKPMRWNPDPARAFDKNANAPQNDADLGDEVIDGGVVDVPSSDIPVEENVKPKIDTKTEVGSDADLSDEVFDIEVPDDDALNLGQLEADLGDDDDDPPDELVAEIAETVLSLLPGTGNVLSAKDAYVSFQAARKALENDDLSEAAIESAFFALGVLGTIPVFGTLARGAKTIGKALKKGRRLGLSRVDGVAKVGRSNSKGWFSKWADNVIKKKAKRTGSSAIVHKFEPEVVSFVNNKLRKDAKRKANALSTNNIFISDKNLMHAARDFKKGLSKEIPDEIIKNMPAIFANKRAVLWDKNHKAVTYVFDVPGEPKKGMFAVSIEMVSKKGPGSKASKTTNSVVTSGMMEVSDLKSIRYENIIGKL